MATTTALFTGLSGVLAHSQFLDVVGNNIANVNTTAFKESRANFAAQFSRTTSIGSAPSTTTGGANPTQIGLGVSVEGTQRNFGSGALTVTGKNTNLAIEGAGLFVLNVAGDQRYTRDGNFSLNAQHELVSPTGGRVQGYGVDKNFNIQSGSLGNLSIPIGSLTVAEATKNVRFSGNLNAGGIVGTAGTQITTGVMNALSTATPPPANAPFADTTTRLIDLDDGSGSALFDAGDSLRLTGAQKDTRILPDSDLTISTSTTIQDFLTFMEKSLGIDTSISSEPGGVTIDDTTGVVQIEGNFGTANELTVDTGNLIRLDGTGKQIAQPFLLSDAQSATGESVRTTFRSYDSLGNPVDVDLTMVLESKDNTGTTWRYYAESPDNIDDHINLSTGTLAFDTTGRLIPPSSVTIQVKRTNTGANDPLSMTLDFDKEGDLVTALTSVNSELASTFQDGSPIGTLTDFSVEADGNITGAFTNGLLRTVGQVVLASFTNPEGLVDLGNQQFKTGPNSGDAVIATPLTAGTGRVVSGSLELSNVDLSQEFINMILASTGYTASSRVITTANNLFQQLLLIGR